MIKRYTNKASFSFTFKFTLLYML